MPVWNHPSFSVFIYVFYARHSLSSDGTICCNRDKITTEGAPTDKLYGRWTMSNNSCDVIAVDQTLTADVWRWRFEPNVIGPHIYITTVWVSDCNMRIMAGVNVCISSSDTADDVCSSNARTLDAPLTNGTHLPCVRWVISFRHDSVIGSGLFGRLPWTTWQKCDFLVYTYTIACCFADNGNQCS